MNQDKVTRAMRKKERDNWHLLNVNGRALSYKNYYEAVVRNELFTIMLSKTVDIDC